jgi:hypothetical protein
MGRLTPNGRLHGRPAKASRVVITHTRLTAGSIPPARPKRSAQQVAKQKERSVAASDAMRRLWGKEQ